MTVPIYGNNDEMANKRVPSKLAERLKKYNLPIPKDIYPQLKKK